MLFARLNVIHAGKLSPHLSKPILLISLVFFFSICAQRQTNKFRDLLEESLYTLLRLANRSKALLKTTTNSVSHKMLIVAIHYVSCRLPTR